METVVQNASAFHSKTLQHCVARKLITQIDISVTIALPSSVPCCKHTSDVWWCATYCALWGPWQNYPPPHPAPQHTRLTTAALWRRGQVKSWRPCGERWARSVCGEELLRTWSMIWLGLAVMRRDLYMKGFIYMFRNISLLSRFLRDADTQNNTGSAPHSRSAAATAAASDEPPVHTS